MGIGPVRRCWVDCERQWQGVVAVVHVGGRKMEPRNTRTTRMAAGPYEAVTVGLVASRAEMHAGGLQIIRALRAEHFGGRLG
jgi:hypothetical protein